MLYEVITERGDVQRLEHVVGFALYVLERVLCEPLQLASGEVAEFWAPGPFVVRSQDPDHPFYMSAHMTGCGRVNPSFSDCRGDPEFVNSYNFV